ncbi:MAG: excinuclease ABC subunit UvrC [Clostridia bacterium]|nr:excinuclease ABC subunit UvrC [Clostridia bacterium]
MKMTANLEWKIHNLPDSPGCYLMKSEGKIIYVGKAKNLKNRVSQYFHASRHHTPKVQAMVEKIDDFDIILVDGELEAFALECNLIKKHRPHYNILLKDDKHYPYIRIDMREDYPKPELVRRQAKDGAKYFGPYQGATVVREVLDVVRNIFPIRCCTYQLNPDKPRRPCVHHQVGQCMAPCSGRVDKEEYRQVVQKVIEFLSGKYAPVIDEMTKRMMDASRDMNYERAALYRDRIRAIQAVMQKQQAISTSQDDRDVIAVLRHEKDALVNMLYIRSGRMIGSESFTLEGAGDEENGEIITQFILQYYSDENVPPQEVLLSADPKERGVIEELLSELHGKKCYLHAPMRGDKMKLIRMAMKNLRDRAEKIDKKNADSHARTIGACEELAEVLGLPYRPRRIEGFDISNTQGVLSVGSQVVMIDGYIRRDQYRIYRIKTVQGANDFASLHEVLTRRLSHGLKEMKSLAEEGKDASEGKFADFPDLILIDGGRGQLNAAMEAMHQQGLDIPMFGLAERIDEIVLPYMDESIILDRHSNALHLIQRLRDEAHRFAITHHRKLRSKASISSRLDGVAGIGEKRKKAILKHFATVEALKNASLDDICAVPGMNRAAAENVYAMLHAGDAAEED